MMELLWFYIFPALFVGLAFGLLMTARAPFFGNGPIIPATPPPPPPSKSSAETLEAPEHIE